MQKSRQVSLTPTRLDFNLHLNFIFFDVIEIVKKTKTLILNATYSAPWHGSYSTSTDVKDFQLSFIAHFRQRIFSLSDVFWCIVGNTRKKCVQLDHTASGCKEHRKQMPFLSTGADRERLSPHGALLTEGLYSSALLNIATKYLNKGVKNNTQRRAVEECREE